MIPATVYDSSLLQITILFSLFLTGGLILAQKLWRKEPWREFLSKIIGSHFYFLYTAYQISIQVRRYHASPNLLRFESWAQSDFIGWMNWCLVMMIFVLFGVSYLIRSAPKSPASRPREILLPFLCAVMPFGIIESPTWIRLAWRGVEFQDIPLLVNILEPFPRFFQGSMFRLATLILTALGNLLTVIGLFFLRRSFSIMTEARELVFRGPYRWIRHPLYAGESLSLLGCFFYLPSWFNLLLTVSFLLLIRLRASFEEGKLAQVFPEYREYEKRVGRFFPKLKGQAP